MIFPTNDEFEDVALLADFVILPSAPPAAVMLPFVILPAAPDGVTFPAARTEPTDAEVAKMTLMAMTKGNPKLNFVSRIEIKHKPTL